MSIKNLPLALSTTALCVTLGFAGSAQATPMTFDFTTPAWDTTNNPAYFGTGLDLSITVDNGGTGTANQTYYNTNIQGIVASAIGGTFTGTFTTYSPNTTGIAAVITTDAAGVATLHFGTQGTSAAWGGFTSTISQSLYIGWDIAGQGGYYPLVVQDSSVNVGIFPSYAQLDQVSPATFGTYNIVQNMAPAIVPLPPAFLSFGMGLVMMGARLRRRKD